MDTHEEALRQEYIRIQAKRAEDTTYHSMVLRDFGFLACEETVASIVARDAYLSIPEVGDLFLSDKPRAYTR